MNLFDSFRFEIYFENFDKFATNFQSRNLNKSPCDRWIYRFVAYYIGTTRWLDIQRLTLVSLSVSQSVSQSVTQSVNQWVNSISQWVSQSVSQWFSKSWVSEGKEVLWIYNASKFSYHNFVQIIHNPTKILNFIRKTRFVIFLILGKSLFQTIVNFHYVHFKLYVKYVCVCVCVLVCVIHVLPLLSRCRFSQFLSKQIKS